MTRNVAVMVWVRRTSIWDYHSKPCDEAVLVDGNWAVEMASLDDLLAFLGKHGPCVLSLSNGQLNVEIYDAYRE